MTLAFLYSLFRNLVLQIMAASTDVWLEIVMIRLTCLIQIVRFIIPCCMFEVAFMSRIAAVQRPLLDSGSLIADWSFLNNAINRARSLYDCTRISSGLRKGCFKPTIPRQEASAIVNNNQSLHNPHMYISIVSSLLHLRRDS